MEDLENQPTNFKFSYTDFKTFLRLIDVTWTNWNKQVFAPPSQTKAYM